MANIDGGGALTFKAVLENDQLNRAIEETMRRVQGLSDAAVAGGKQMDEAFLQTADGIRDALGQIGQACEIHERELAKLERQYEDLGRQAGAALMSGRDDEYRAIEDTRACLSGEIKVRTALLKEARQLSDALEEQASKQEAAARKAEESAHAHRSLRTRIMELKEEMALLVDQGINEESDAYKALADELGRLQDIQGDIARQGRILSNDQAAFQGIIQGLSGISGGLSAATGAVSLFAGENENLQKIMTRVQSVMAITIGLQQVSQTLNKDSAFMLVTVRRSKELLTSAELKFAAALGASNVAAKALMGTLTLGLSVAVTGVIYLIDKMMTKSRESKKAQEEFTSAVIDGSYQAIGKVEALAHKYEQLGDDMKAKERFIKDNQRAFEDLGLAINGVTDAENVLIDNKDAFIDAQIAKAKALAYSQQAAEKVKKLIELQAEYESMSDTKRVWVPTSSLGTGQFILMDNDAKKKKKKEIDAAREELKNDYDNISKEEIASTKLMKEAGIRAINEYKEGTVGAIEQAIAAKEKALKGMVPYSEEWKRTNKEIEELRKKVSAPVQAPVANDKDPFVEMLKKRKAEYALFYKWQNSSEEEVRKAAKTEFSELLKQGHTYEAFLKTLHSRLSSLPDDGRHREQLRAIKNELAEITKTTALETFSDSLKKELEGASHVLKTLEIVSRRREELANDGTETDNEKKRLLDDAEKNALQKQEQETQKLLDDYASYLDKKIKLDLEYSNDLALLEKARAKATTDEERRKIDLAMANRKKQYDKDSKLSGDSEYDQMLQTYRTFEQKKEAIDEEFKEKSRLREEMLAGFQKELSEAKTEEEKQAIQKRIADNEKMAEGIKKAYQEALSKLAIDEMKVSSDWEKMFGNLDEIATEELERLLATIEGKTAVLGVELSPEDFKVVQERVKALRDKIKERNPFKILAHGLRELTDAVTTEEKKAALLRMFDSAARSAAHLKEVISSVANTLDALGIKGSEEIGHAVHALDGLARGAWDILSGNPVQVIGGTIKAIGSVVNYVAGANDRRAERSIRRHRENVSRLTATYKDLERQTSKSLGKRHYRLQKESIDNMKQQREELQRMIDAESGKKKSDGGKIEGWKEQQRELERRMTATVEGMRDNLLATDAKDIASRLGDALVQAFARGEDASRAWGETVKGVVRNMVKNILVQKVLYEPINQMAEKFTSKWVSKDGAFRGYEALENSLDDFEKELNGLYPRLERSMNVLKGRLTLEDSPGGDRSLAGAVKGVTEETAGIVAGQLNAIRINQGDANNMLRQQLSTLGQIARNTSYNRHLEKLDGILSALRGQENNPLRSQGLQ